jgi:hypothetical protein
MKTPQYLKDRANYIFKRHYARSVRTGKMPLNPALLGVMLEVAGELQDYLIKLDACAAAIGEVDGAFLESLRRATTHVPFGSIMSKECFFMKSPCEAVLDLSSAKQKKARKKK